jgi:hypothetical protein
MPAVLIQIQRGYRAQWNNLALSVEQDSSQWMLHVRDAARDETLYTAYRGGARAAQVAAAEFAISQVHGFDSRIVPDRLARELNWQEYW